MSALAAALILAVGVSLLAVNAAVTVARTFFDVKATGWTTRPSAVDAAYPELDRLFDERETTIGRLAVLEVLCLCGATGMIAIAAFDFAGSAMAVGAVVLLTVVAFVGTVGVPRSWVLADPLRATGVAVATATLANRIPGLASLAAVGAAVGDRLLDTSEDEPGGSPEMATPPVEAERGTAGLRASVDRFARMNARGAMVPRTDMVLVDADFRIDDSLEVALLHGYSRLPVLGDDRDDIVGIVYAKDLMKRSMDGEGAKSLSLVTHDPWFVPETKLLSDLLREMQATKTHLAMVVDEYGGTAGLVTLEDVLEELVGDIVDEFDHEVDEIVSLSPTIHRVNARATVAEVNEALGIDLPMGDWTTVGGLAFDRFGRVPALGERIEIAECSFKVISLAKRRIVGLQLEIPEPETSTDGPAIGERVAHDDGDRTSVAQIGVNNDRAGQPADDQLGTRRSA